MGKIRDILQKNLIDNLEKNNISQKQLADLLGVSQAAVTNWVKGKNSPDIELVAKMCNIFNISITEFMKPTDSEECNSNKAELNLSEHERKIILAYRNQPAMQKAVDRVLAISEEVVEYIPSLVAARSQENNVPIQVENVPDLSAIEPDDSDL